MTSDSEDGMLSKDYKETPVVGEGNGGGILGGGSPLKKGPWTLAEDAILADFVNKHGEGNWNAVQKHSGLLRSGKSCRLRWTNHLRPDLKKNSISPGEEQHIIELHARLGNKWALMAAELSGRTDNEIKNYWNTRIKRRKRAGLPIYPTDIQATHEDEQHRNSSTSSPWEKHNLDIMPTNTFGIPAVGFENLDLSQQFRSPSFINLPGIPFDISHRNCLMFPMVHSQKCLLQSNTDDFLAFDQYQVDGCDKIAQSFKVHSLNDHDLSADRSSLCSVNPLMSHAISDGNSSSSQAVSWAVKELPSFQNADTHQVGSREETSPRLPPSESFDTVFQLPIPIEHAQSSSLYRQSSGLLEEIVYESETLKISKNSPCHQSLYVSVVDGDMADSSSQNAPETEWDIYSDPFSISPIEQAKSNSLYPQSSGLLEEVVYESVPLKISKNNSCLQSSNVSGVGGDMVGSSSQNASVTEWDIGSDPISPTGHSAASLFSECTPICGTLFDESHLIQTLPGCKVNQEADGPVMEKCNAKEDDRNQMIFATPDLLLASDWYSHDSWPSSENSILTDDRRSDCECLQQAVNCMSIPCQHSKNN